eukprot:scaffold100708_cov37-Tisochrysis_lutea.AAC.4
MVGPQAQRSCRTDPSSIAAHHHARYRTGRHPMLRFWYNAVVRSACLRRGRCTTVDYPTQPTSCTPRPCNGVHRHEARKSPRRQSVQIWYSLRTGSRNAARLEPAAGRCVLFTTLKTASAASARRFALTSLVTTVSGSLGRYRSPFATNFVSSILFAGATAGVIERNRGLGCGRIFSGTTSDLCYRGYGTLAVQLSANPPVK